MGGADLVAGRRHLAHYAADEGLIRLLAGGLVQATRRLVVMSAIRDTQCGFKVFRRELGRAIFVRTRVRSFAFDIEVLFLARKLGARMVELPVSTTYRGESTFSVRKHLPLFLKDIVQIRLNDLAGRYDH
jgi:dolichyl-phosphate beta-glucosyltransferase